MNLSEEDLKEIAAEFAKDSVEEGRCLKLL